MSKKTKRYDEEFKANAVKMVVEKDRLVKDVAKDLGIPEPTLRRWLRANKEPKDDTEEKLAKLEAENKKLKKELNNANDTVEVLKKSVAIFTKP